MDWDLVERLIGLVEGSRVTELTLRHGPTTVRIARTPAEPGSGEDRVVPAPTAAAPASRPAERAAASHVVSAGMPGTFYRAPAPDQAPFVSEGESVEEGQVLAILEAMKTLNPVEADRAGRIGRILVENGASVVAGTPLFELAPVVPG